MSSFLKCLKMSQNVQLRRIVVRTDLFFKKRVFIFTERFCFSESISKHDAKNYWGLQVQLKLAGRNSDLTDEINGVTVTLQWYSGTPTKTGAVTVTKQWYTYILVLGQ